MDPYGSSEAIRGPPRQVLETACGTLLAFLDGFLHHSAKQLVVLTEPRLPIRNRGRGSSCLRLSKDRFRWACESRKTFMQEHVYHSGFHAVSRVAYWRSQTNEKKRKRKAPVASRILTAHVGQYFCAHSGQYNRCCCRPIVVRRVSLAQ